MAGDWIKVEHDLHEKPEVAVISDATGLDPDTVVGKLIRVWRWFDRHTSDGNAPTVTLSLLDRITAHEGFASALQKAGWLDIEEQGISVPNFDRHISKSAKDRALGRERVKRSRNASTVTEALPEKRREEKKIKKTKAKENGGADRPLDSNGRPMVRF
jgi:CelD/BcsL family acetyltransferase involved in cellulose biosynthesis